MPGGGAQLIRPSIRSSATMNRELDARDPVKLDVLSSRGARGELICSNEGGVEFRAAAEEQKEGWISQSCCGDIKETGESFPADSLLGASLELPSSVCIWSCPTVLSSPGGKLKFKLQKSGRFECSSRIAAEQFVSHVQREVCWGGRSAPPRVVAVVNPTSGQGRGSSIFSKQVLPLLRDVAGLSVEVHATASKHHATSIVRELQSIDKVDVILYVGGDGTIFEGLQGLLSRPDWERAALVPFATCPTGSGNGMAASLGVFDPVAAAFTVAKRRQHPVDVASVLQPSGSRYFLLLSLAYGLMSNLDIGTEHLRWMGEPRFTYGALREVLGGRSYALRAAIWPGGVPSLHQGDAEDAQDGGQPSLASTASPLDVHAPHHASSDPAESRGGETGGTEGGPGEASSLLGHGRRGGSKRRGAHRSHAHACSSSSSSLPAGATPQSDATAAPGDVSVDVEAGSAFSSPLQGPPLPILSAMGGRLPPRVPSHQSDLPPGWMLLPEETTCKAQYFMAHNTQYLALNARLNPKGVLSDGLWELITAQTSGGFWDTVKGIQMLLQTETGDHVNMDIVQTQQMRAMMLEPLSGDRTWTVLDGEAAPNLMTYLEVHPRLCRALVAPGWEDAPKS